VLAPGPQDQATQVIDGRDLACWMRRLLADGASGAFHAAAPASPFGMRELPEVAPSPEREASLLAGWSARRAV
jgi:2'-hydroxyisoflavone reductase